MRSERGGAQLQLRRAQPADGPCRSEGREPARGLQLPLGCGGAPAERERALGADGGLRLRQSVPADERDHCGGPERNQWGDPELLNIPIIYSPGIGGEGRWSAPVTQEAVLQCEERFAEAAQRIRNEDPSRFPRNPNF